VANLNFEKDQVYKAIDKCNFSNLQKLEAKSGFVEAISDKEGNVKKFFNLGPNNNWKNLLDPKIKLQIESLFEKEMKEIGYIN
jgi:hypothetical protein